MEEYWVIMGDVLDLLCLGVVPALCAAELVNVSLAIGFNVRRYYAGKIKRFFFHGAYLLIQAVFTCFFAWIFFPRLGVLVVLSLVAVLIVTGLLISFSRPSVKYMTPWLVFRLYDQFPFL